MSAAGFGDWIFFVPFLVSENWGTVSLSFCNSSTTERRKLADLHNSSVQLD